MTRTMKRALLTLVAAVVAIALGGCATSQPPVEYALPFFPTDVREGPRGMMAARSSGTLTLEAGCLWLRSGQERDLLIWPKSNRVEWRAGRLVVVDAPNSFVARLGDPITVGGGEWHATPDAVVDIDLEVESIIRRAVPPACRLGRYWLGAVIDVGR